MSHGTFLRFVHRCDVYSRSITVNSAGQKYPSFTLQKASVPCEFQNGSSERRIAPYVDNVDQFQLIVPKDFVSFFVYPSRVKNIRDRYGNVIYPGEFELINIDKKTGFNGKVNHIIASIQLVVENG